MPAETQKNRTTLKPFVLGMALAAPLVGIGLLASSNAYRAMGTEGAIDCDGPLSVLIFAVPGFIVYAAGLTAFLHSSWRHLRIRDVAIAAVTAAICVALGVKIAVAVGDHSSVSHQMTCGSKL